MGMQKCMMQNKDVFGIRWYAPTCRNSCVSCTGFVVTRHMSLFQCKISNDRAFSVRISHSGPYRQSTIWCSKNTPPGDTQPIQ